MTRKRFASLLTFDGGSTGSRAALALAGLGAACAARRSDAALKDRVSQLVERLDAAKVEAREAAEEALIKLGPRILPLLPDAEKVGGAERKERLGRDPRGAPRGDGADQPRRARRSRSRARGSGSPRRSRSSRRSRATRSPTSARPRGPRRPTPRSTSRSSTSRSSRPSTSSAKQAEVTPELLHRRRLDRPDGPA